VGGFAVPFKVVRAVTIEQLEKDVNDLMKDGWTPMGEVREESYANTPERFYISCVKPEALTAEPSTPMQVVIANKADAPVLVSAVAAGPSDVVVEPLSGRLEAPIKKTVKKKKKTTTKK
jgi:hypothetical protein